MYSSRIRILPAEHKVPRLRKTIRVAHRLAPLGMTMWEEHSTKLGELYVTCDRFNPQGCRHFKCTAASVCLKPPLPFFTFGIPYFGLISWHPSSQNTPPSADSGVGIGEFTAISRSASITRSTSEISSAFSFAVSHFFSLTR